MTAPVRLQLSRRGGFNLQALSLATNGLPAVVVSRGSKRWGNPFKVVRCGAALWKVVRDNHVFMAANTRRAAASAAVALFRAYADELGDVTDLRGKNLACVCAPDEPCHADVLLELANRPQVPSRVRGEGEAPAKGGAP